MDHYRFIQHRKIPPVLVAGPVVHVGVPEAAWRSDRSLPVRRARRFLPTRQRRRCMFEAGDNRQHRCHGCGTSWLPSWPRHTSLTSPGSRRPARPIHGSGRMHLTQSAKDGIRPRSSKTCCSPIKRTGTWRPVLLTIVIPKIVSREPDSLRMVPESAMAEVCDNLFRPVEPAMDCNVVLGHAAKLAR